ncbi:replication initiation protein, partial [Rodentibacter caecimuris]|uniref:replication initiation protein n=1 Tax=Rodentibacter caecimuris TaxID=1796644 RepID=UPI00178CCD6A
MYTPETFKSSLHHRLLCSNDLTYGTKIRVKEKAIEHKYIQFNDHYIKFLWLDLDHQTTLIWEDVGLPPPNFIIRNKNNCKSHYVWALSSPIYRD